MIFCICCITVSSVDCALFFHRFGYDFFITFDVYLIPSKCETFKTIVLTMNLNDFTIQEEVNSDNFNDFFPYQFWHLILMSCGIDFGTILASNSMFWGDRFWG